MSNETVELAITESCIVHRNGVHCLSVRKLHDNKEQADAVEEFNRLIQVMTSCGCDDVAYELLIRLLENDHIQQDAIDALDCLCLYGENDQFSDEKKPLIVLEY